VISKKWKSRIASLANNDSNQKKWTFSDLIRYEIGTTNVPRCSVPDVRDHTIGPKTVENGDKYSTAPKRNMNRSACGNLVQWVNL